MMFKRTLYDELWIGQETGTAQRPGTKGLSHNRLGEPFAVLNVGGQGGDQPRSIPIIIEQFPADFRQNSSSALCADAQLA